MARQIRKCGNRKKTASTEQQSQAHSVHILRCVLSLIIVGVILGGLTLLAGPPAETIIEYNRSIDAQYHMKLKNSKPQVVLLGNSLLGDGVDEDQFTHLTKRRTLKLCSGGWASAAWYLAFKNVIIEASPKPQTVVILFRDHFLTDPAYRVRGKYMAYMDKLAGPEEPLLERLAFLNAMNPLTYQLNRNWSLFQKREGLKKGLESNIKSWVGSVYGHPDDNGLNNSIEQIFDTDNLSAKEFGDAQLKSEEANNKTQYDLKKSLPVSFLPAMVQMAHENDIQLIFVRVKRRREAQGLATPAGLDDYIRNLQQWFTRQQVPFIDFSDDPHIKIEHYGNGDHLNKQDGRALFTKLLVERLKPYLDTPARAPQ
jgi:hypothetical protein